MGGATPHIDPNKVKNLPDPPGFGLGPQALFPLGTPAGFNVPQQKTNLFSGVLQGIGAASPKANALLASTGDFTPEASAVAGAGMPAVKTPELTVLHLDQYKDYTVITGTKKTYKSKGYVGSSEQDKDFQKSGGMGDRFTLVPTSATIPEAILAFRKQALDDQAGYQKTVAQLVASGYLSPKDATFSAYTNLVGQAYLDALKDISSNQQDAGDNPSKIQTVDQWLSQLAQEKDQNGDGLPDYLKSSAPKVPQIQNVWTDPAAVQASVQSTAEKLLGRKLSADEVSQFASAFHGKEAAFNAARNNFDAPQIDVSNPDLGASSQQFIQDNNGPEMGFQADAAYITALQGLMGTRR